MNGHLSENQIQHLVDRNGSNEDMMRWNTHLQTCEACRSRTDAFRRLDRVLHMMPLVEPSEGFTGKVLKKIGLREAPSFWWMFFKNFAPLVALAIVLVITYFVLSASGLFSQNAPSTTSVLSLPQVSGAFAKGTDTMTAWLATYFSWIGKGGKLVLYLVVIFGGVALLDRFILTPTIRRKALTGRF